MNFGEQREYLMALEYFERGWAYALPPGNRFRLIIQEHARAEHEFVDGCPACLEATL